MDLRSAGNTIARSPGWQLTIGGGVLALAFPSHLAGAIGLAIVAGGLGVGVAKWWPRLPEWIRAPAPQLSTTFVVTLVVALGFSTFWDTLTVSPDWQMGDWGPQHAVLKKLMPNLPGLHAPVWNEAVGTGDAPFELYPSLTYFVTGHVALIAGLEDDLPLAMMIVAVIVHIGIAVTTTLLAMRVAPKPIALVVGVLALVDSGGVAHGGTVGLFRWALLHSAMALLFGTIAALGVIAALERPRLRASIAIWLGTALAVACHPAGLIAAAASMVALAAVALLASDIPPRRALIAIGHLILGVALAAFIWMPLAERILDYGQHFPNLPRSAARLLEDLLASPSPITAFAMLSYAGYFGILAGLWSRRGAVIYLATITLVLLVGLCDAPYLALDLAPGKGIARLGTERLAQIARPFLAGIGAYTIWVVLGHATSAWHGASPRRKMIAAAAIGILAGSLLRVVPAVWRSASGRAYNETLVFAADPLGRQELTAWAFGRAAENRPDSYGRALFDIDTHEHFHLTAITGLPTLHLSAQPDLLLRERIEDLTPASLKRFDIRWSIGVGKSPTWGDADTEIAVGSFRIRTVKEWDGQFARIEKGSGTVKTTRLDDDTVEIEVTSGAPVLVALGTGFYPRWRATHASGADEPVYAMRSTPISNLSVVSAWVLPGKTTFTCDGPLPSDGKGRLISILAMLCAIAAIVAWRIPRIRIRVLRRLARARARLPGLSKHAPLVAPGVIGLLLIRGCVDAGGPTDAIEIGTGIRGNATVQARLAGDVWQTCDYQRIQGTYQCEGLLVAYDGLTALLNDATPSWGFNTPGIMAAADVPGVEMRVTLREHLSGTYWMSTNGDGTLSVSGEADRLIEPAVIVYGDQGVRTITIDAPVPTTWWQFTMVREQTIIPARPYLAKPPDEPPTTLGSPR